MPMRRLAVLWGGAAALAAQATRPWTATAAVLSATAPMLHAQASGSSSSGAKASPWSTPWLTAAAAAAAMPASASAEGSDDEAGNDDERRSSKRARKKVQPFQPQVSRPITGMNKSAHPKRTAKAEAQQAARARLPLDRATAHTLDAGLGPDKQAMAWGGEGLNDTERAEACRLAAALAPAEDDDRWEVSSASVGPRRAAFALRTATRRRPPP